MFFRPLENVLSRQDNFKTKVRCLVLAGNKTEKACNVVDTVLTHEDNAPRINLRVGVIDSFMPSQDGIKIIEMLQCVLCYI